MAGTLSLISLTILEEQEMSEQTDTGGGAGCWNEKAAGWWAAMSCKNNRERRERGINLSRHIHNQNKAIWARRQPVWRHGVVAPASGIRQYYALLSVVNRREMCFLVACVLGRESVIMLTRLEAGKGFWRGFFDSADGVI